MDRKSLETKLCVFLRRVTTYRCSESKIMKIKKILPILGLVLTAGVGLAIGLNSAKQEIKSASASEMVTFYFDYTAGGFWGEAGAVTKLQTNDGTKYAATLAYEDSPVYKATIDVESVTSIKWVRLDPDNLNGNPWNESAETTNFTLNYMNLYDNGGGSHTYSQEPATTLYVTDLSHSKLSTNHYAHIWNHDDSRAGTSWPGRKMNLVSANTYEVTFKGGENGMKGICFNNNDEQTADLGIGSDGDYCILTPDWQMCWGSGAAATFVDTYMHFSDVALDNEGDTANCDSYYSAAKTAYNNLGSNAIRQEVLGNGTVKTRLTAWAHAHGEVINDDGSTISASNRINPIAIVDNKNMVATIIAAGGALLLLVTFGVFFIRRRKFN